MAMQSIEISLWSTFDVHLSVSMSCLLFLQHVENKKICFLYKVRMALKGIKDLKK